MATVVALLIRLISVQAGQVYSHNKLGTSTQALKLLRLLLKPACMVIRVMIKVVLLFDQVVLRKHDDYFIPRASNRYLN